MELNLSEKPDAIIGIYDGIEYNLIKTKNGLYEGTINNPGENKKEKGFFEIEDKNHFLLEGTSKSKNKTETRKLEHIPDTDNYKGEILVAFWKSRENLSRKYIYMTGIFNNRELRFEGGKMMEGSVKYNVNNTFDLRTLTKENDNFQSLKILKNWVKNTIFKGTNKLSTVTETQRIEIAKIMDRKFSKYAKTLASKMF